jgi:hypothetical protein
MRVLIVYILTLRVVVFPIEASAEREIPDNNLAYPALIRLSSGSSGSGFLLKHSRENFSCDSIPCSF